MVRMHFYHRFGILRLCRDCSSKYNVYEKKSPLCLECRKEHLKEEFGPMRNNSEIIELTSIRYRLHSLLGGNVTASVI